MAHFKFNTDFSTKPPKKDKNRNQNKTKQNKNKKM